MKLSGAELRDKSRNPCAKERELIEELLKARKQMHIYPANNPIHKEASRKLFEKFRAFLDADGPCTWKIERYSITCNDKTIYAREEREDNLALFFFQDGLKILSFTRGLTEQELGDFVRILNTNFESGDGDDDIVTLMWEADFEHIKYMVDENFLSDWELTEKKAITDQAIKSAHSAGLMSAETKPWRPEGTAEDKHELIRSEIDGHYKPRTGKTAQILLDVLRQGHDTERTVAFLKETILYALSTADVGTAVHILEATSGPASYESGLVDTSALRPLTDAVNSPEFINTVGDLLQSDRDIKNDEFMRYAAFFDARAIPPLMRFMGREENMQGRRLLINAMSATGRLDVHAVGRFMEDDRWYVVRNTALILGNIASTEAVGYLKRAVSHEDSRVRRSVVRALGASGDADVDMLMKAMQDSNVHVRVAAAAALSSLGTAEAKSALFREITSRQFVMKELNEKKEFFGALSRWRDPDIQGFCLKILARRRLLKKSRHEETRACAAYALGLMEAKDSVSEIRKSSESGGIQLRKMSLEALRRLEG